MRKKDRRRLKLLARLAADTSAVVGLIHFRLGRVEDRTKALLDLSKPPDVFEKFGQLTPEERAAKKAAK